MCRETSARPHLPSWQSRLSASRPAKSSTKSRCDEVVDRCEARRAPGVVPEELGGERGRRPVACVGREAACPATPRQRPRRGGAPCGVVRAVPAKSARRRTRSGKRTPHSQACWAPIEKPSASSTCSIPRSSRRRRCASTSSPIVRLRERSVAIAGRRRLPVAQLARADDEPALRVERPARADPAVERGRRARVLVGEEDDVVARLRKRPVRPIGEPRGGERPAELELEFVEVEGARPGGRHCALERRSGAARTGLTRAARRCRSVKTNSILISCLASRGPLARTKPVGCSWRQTRSTTSSPNRFRTGRGSCGIASTEARSATPAAPKRRARRRSSDRRRRVPRAAAAA